MKRKNILDFLIGGKLFFFCFLFFLLFGFVYAFEMETSSFSVDNSHIGIAGGEGDSTSYDSRSTLTYQQGGNDDGSTTSYIFNSGWFVLSRGVGGVSVSSVECSNDTLNYYSCGSMAFGMNVTHIRVNCTPRVNVSDVRFTLVNVQDGVNYIDNVSYTYDDGGYFVYNSSYYIRDSGDWRLEVTCYGFLNTYNSTTLWSLPWGWLSVNLIQPIADTSVKIYNFFTFRSRVVCMDGECGDVSVTLDPQECSEESVCINESLEVCENLTMEVCDLNESSGLELCLNESVLNCSTEIFENCSNETICIEMNETEDNISLVENEVNVSLTDENESIEISENVSEEIIDREGKVVFYSDDVDVIKQAFVISESEEAQVLGEDFGERFDYLTPILAMEVEGEGSLAARVYLPKLNSTDLNLIRKCEDWDFNLSVCVSGWVDYTTQFGENESYVWFIVDSFSAYAGGNYSGGELSYLVVWDENDQMMPNASENRLVGEQVKFFADYQTSSNGSSIDDGNCSISFDGGNYSSMDYNSTYGYYVYNRSFANSSLYIYFVSCQHSNYTDLSAADEVPIANADAKSGAVSTSSGATPFYTTDSNPQSCLDLIAGDECNTTWLVNVTGILGRNYTFFVIYNMTSNQAYVDDNESSHLSITIFANDSIVPVIIDGVVLPTLVKNNSNVSIYMTAQDNVQIDECWAEVLYPNSTLVSFYNLCDVGQIFVSNVVGDYNVTFFVNDTEGNLANLTESVIATPPLNFTLNVNQSNVSIQTVIRFYYPEVDEEIIYEESIVSSGKIEAFIPLGIYDVDLRSFQNRLKIVVVDVNATVNNNRFIGIDKLSVPAVEDLITYGISQNLTFASADITIYYDDTNFSDENNLRLYKCDNWNFSGRVCDGSWVDVSSSSLRNLTGDYFKYTTTSFSGFAIREVAPAVEEEGPDHKFDIDIEGQCLGEPVKIDVKKYSINGIPVSEVKIDVFEGDESLTGNRMETIYTEDRSGAEIIFWEEGFYTLTFIKRGYRNEEVVVEIINCTDCLFNRDCDWNEYCSGDRKCIGLVCDVIENHTCVVKEVEKPVIEEEVVEMPKRKVVVEELAMPEEDRLLVNAVVGYSLLVVLALVLLKIAGKLLVGNLGGGVGK